MASALARNVGWQQNNNTMNDKITIAVSKGRILDESLPLLARIDVRPLEKPGTSRKLIFQTNHPGIKLIVIRAADVPTYVSNGGAELGIAGKDVLMEYESDNLYEPLDLKIARCRMMSAGLKGGTETGGRLRVATKYVATTRNFFAARGQQVEIIKLYGSMELAPVLGLSDQIVDLVNTGNTLKANGLIPIEHVAAISARLIANKAAMKMKQGIIKPFIKNLSGAIEQ